MSAGSRLAQRISAVEDDLQEMRDAAESLRSDRDRYRADAASLRASSMRLHAAVANALEELQHAQSEVLGSLLAPGSPDDIP